jgi:hypothetical protein
MWNTHATIQVKKSYSKKTLHLLKQANSTLKLLFVWIKNRIEFQIHAELFLEAEITSPTKGGVYKWHGETHFSYSEKIYHHPSRQYQ